jgi:hypothetical protein
MASFQDQLAALNAAKKVANLDKNGGTSTGQVVAESGQAGIQNPQSPSAIITIPTVSQAPNAGATASVTVQGITNEQLTAIRNQTTDSPTVSLQQSQATPTGDIPVFQPSQLNKDQTGTGGVGYITDSPNVANPKTQAGAGSPKDDYTTSGSATQRMIAASLNETIIAQPNILDQFTSYTYGLSWYLLTPDQQTAFTKGSRNVATWQLLAQSGGASQVGRNRYFSLDYYMDNLNIETKVPLKGTGLSHSAIALDFTITEPNGLTLINNLFQAVNTLYKENGVVDAPYLQACYCMVIRFYGYDEAGNLVNPIRARGLQGYANQTDQTAVVEKYYPFVIENLTFRLTSNKQIEYHLKGKPIAQQTALSYDRGTIPFQFELTGETVQDILVGNPVGTQAPVSPGERQASPTPTTSAPKPGPTVGTLPIKQQAAIAAGTDPNAVTDGGMAFGGGGL